ncbi:RdRP-domain-containing protein [Delitschia confertaspora ATCC 74209]|uniref:RNA-dependent RNA polymerase n=1 Tax=Delitschia confertaspora ATCC 74209 TaxID=1513339 RepID=A0A9P4MPG1_9PLEO|nr:RdRP-domain-containing protein [Delitschia confertaspora ATCC 74209]
MDVHVGRVPPQVTEQQLKKLFRSYLASFNILAFDCKKYSTKSGLGFAFLTLPEADKARRFLQYWHQLGYNAPRLFGSALVLNQGHNQPDEFHVRSLLAEQQKVASKLAKEPPKPKAREQSGFHFSSLSVGIWGYEGDAIGVDSQFQDNRNGVIVFGNSSLEIHLAAKVHYMTTGAARKTTRLDIDYASVDNVAISSGNQVRPTLSLTLTMPPKIYEVIDTKAQTDSYLANLLDTISITPNQDTLYGINPSLPGAKKHLARICCIDDAHAKVVGLCMVYQIVLEKDNPMLAIQRLFKTNLKMPPLNIFQTATLNSKANIVEEFTIFCSWMIDSNVYPDITFPIRFQLHSLVLEGYLPPAKVTQLLGGIEALAKSEGPRMVAEALRKCRYEIPSPSRNVRENEYSISALLSLVREYVSYEKDLEPLQDLVIRYEHLVHVYKATVTPTGLFLRGPDAEVSNRVLRRYSEQSEYFLRVTFADEDGMPVQFDGRASQEEVWLRFRKFLQMGMFVAGRGYKFLGFSHSSLRNQTCWFMAPFMHEGKEINSEEIILDIGDFSHLRCPAKCAARIGQAFSDTTTAIKIAANQMSVVPDVERNGRCFSDGCGTISMQLLRKVWKMLPSRFLQPSVLQIRFKGAKGVVSLDARLRGDVLALRNSMLKFEAGSTWNDIELCGAGYKPLPCFLNRQFIKILEDLGVPKKVFLDLQTDEMDILKMVTRTPVNAANFLESSFVGKSAKTPMLIKLMNDIGLSFRKDQFLTDMVEIATMSKLRDMKYRGRIQVKDGVVLYGIMDETGILKEDQVYVPVRKKVDNHFEMYCIVGDVAITRAPALHPGDIQRVEAVEVPEDSPLRHLYNCVVFSRFGERDLPSQLGGGDLDGDIFNVIYDQRLLPKWTTTAADYPRQAPVELDRPIVTSDMTEFFIDFMKSDQLGRISTLHLCLADREPNGTFAPSCIKLAELASIAVDFSKSGIPVDQTQIPKARPVRPDFMAPGPRFVLDKKIALEETKVTEEEDEADPVSLLNGGQRKTLYYESEKILGELYRAIDEKQFFQQMRQISEATQLCPDEEPIMQTLWKYVKRETMAIQWEHHRQLGEEIRETYESNLIDIMTSLSPHPRERLQEVEVFTGNILGKNRGKENKRTREASKELSERFNRDVEFTVKRIMNSEELDEDYDASETLPRAIACFAVGIEEKKRWWKLESFKYVAAAVCLEELWKFHGLKGLRRVYQTEPVNVTPYLSAKASSLY